MKPNYVSGNRYHNAASTNINASSGAWVELGEATGLDKTYYGIEISSTIGSGLEIGYGLTAGGVTRLFVLSPGGGPSMFRIKPLAKGTILWVRSLEASAVSAGALYVNLVDL